MTNDLKVKMAEKNEAGMNPDKYNPITNPMPWINQNPYINREKNFAKSTRATSIYT